MTFVEELKSEILSHMVRVHKCCTFSSCCYYAVSHILVAKWVRCSIDCVL